MDGIITCSNCNKNVKIECGVPNFVKFSKVIQLKKKQVNIMDLVGKKVTYLIDFQKQKSGTMMN